MDESVTTFRVFISFYALQTLTCCLLLVFAPTVVLVLQPTLYGTHSHLAFATLPHIFRGFLKTHCFQQAFAPPPSDSPKCLRFGHWLTLRTLNIHSFTYLLTYHLNLFENSGHSRNYSSVFMLCSADSYQLKQKQVERKGWISVVCLCFKHYAVYLITFLTKK